MMKVPRIYSIFQTILRKSKNKSQLQVNTLRVTEIKSMQSIKDPKGG